MTINQFNDCYEFLISANSRIRISWKWPGQELVHKQKGIYMKQLKYPLKKCWASNAPEPKSSTIQLTYWNFSFRCTGVPNFFQCGALLNIEKNIF